MLIPFEVSLNAQYDVCELYHQCWTEGTFSCVLQRVPWYAQRNYIVPCPQSRHNVSTKCRGYCQAQGCVKALSSSLRSCTLHMSDFVFTTKWNFDNISGLDHSTLCHHSSLERLSRSNSLYHDPTSSVIMPPDSRK